MFSAILLREILSETSITLIRDEFATAVDSRPAESFDIIGVDPRGGGAVVGDTELDYLGYSYGTFIGEVYAQEFPHNVAHMVLDGAVDPTQEGTETADQAAGFEMALGDWISWCVDDHD
jgi:pimeloyl-ACP methyl ester carboxylesterase